MPHVNLYVRKKDWIIYQAIKNKPEWLHMAINQFKMSHPVILPEPKAPAPQPLQVNHKSHGPIINNPPAVKEAGTFINPDELF